MMMPSMVRNVRSLWLSIARAAMAEGLEDAGDGIDRSPNCA